MTTHTYEIPDNTSVWDDDPEYPIEDWRSEIINDYTRIGYWEWVYHCKEQEYWESRHEEAGS